MALIVQPDGCVRSYYLSECVIVTCMWSKGCSAVAGRFLGTPMAYYHANDLHGTIYTICSG